MRKTQRPPQVRKVYASISKAQWAALYVELYCTVLRQDSPHIVGVELEREIQTTISLQLYAIQQGSN